MKKILLLLVAGLSCWFVTMAQDTTGVVIKEAPKPKYARATFNATKIINLQSTEIVPKNILQFMVSHHFSYLWNKDQSTEDNLAQFLGINSGVAQTYLSFDYSLNDYANLGVALLVNPGMRVGLNSGCSSANRSERYSRFCNLVFHGQCGFCPGYWNRINMG